MKLTINNTNYSAVVARVETIIPLEWCDNIVWVPFFWYQAIVSKDVKLWDIGIVFTAETQLSEEYCKKNNLYRDQELNIDKSKKWYIENNRRVRAVKFRWHKSSALFMPLQSLSYITSDCLNLNIWDSFDTINDSEVCKKYEIIISENGKNKVRWKTKTFIRVDTKIFPEHLDTENYKRNKHFLKDYDLVYITQKLHWTSWRFWYIKVKKQLSLLDRIVKFFGVKVEDTEYDYIAGSRKVVKDLKTREGEQWFYNSDVWNIILQRYKHIIPKNRILYWEIIWWDWEKPIQRNYTYNLAKWEMELYVYRIVVINEDWVGVDLWFDQIEEFCKNNWLKPVPLLETCYHLRYDSDKYSNLNYYKNISISAVPLCNESPCDEWVVIRKDWLQPYVLKDKSSDFLEHETKLLDKWDIDIESLQSNE